MYFFADGLENNNNHLEIVTQVIILVVLESGFCPVPLIRAFRQQQSE